ncbi:MAG TPA: NAD(P)H-hydrate dehydratase [Opitutaceae bacterium]|nr:NAD(P)H-hydrate dehydratase [Opitutaceae bacterium]
MTTLPAHPILSCDEARALEARLFGGDEAREWPAMQCAGRAIGVAVLEDFQEIGGFSAAGRVLVLVGKGHNGGDALIATRTILEQYPQAGADVLFVFGEQALRPLTQRAWQELLQTAPQRVAARRVGEGDLAYDLCLDGVFGFQFRPPLDERAGAALRWANARSVRLRAAVDLPSGLDTSDAFRADFTYATGSVKAPALQCPNAGRLRNLDLGFFDPARQDDWPGHTDFVLLPSVLSPLSALRSPLSDKRAYGHLFVLGASRNYPGAALLAVLAALRSGAGLVTAFVPESLAPAFAARAPEAMWIGWPETAEGGLALAGHYLIRERLARATALVLGPGLGRETETLTLAANIMEAATVPVVLDADALQPDIVRAGSAPRVLTPHAGEFARIAGDAALRNFCGKTGATVVLKGPITHIGTAEAVYHSCFGGPVLARGGSGDLLAGLIGGLLAQAVAEQLPVPSCRAGSPAVSLSNRPNPAGSGTGKAAAYGDAALQAAARGVVWHGRAADALARAKGQVAVQTTQVLDYLSAALRDVHS